jgi:8-oxo-dGTP pyrophosphatase MutT (NUDIX family)
MQFRNNQKFTSLTTAGLLVIKNRKLLLAFSKNKKAWYLPGGKTDQGEDTRSALIREITEELNIDLNPDQLKYYTHISAQAFGEKNNVIMEQDCFIYNLFETPNPSAEIEALNYFNTGSYGREPSQVPGVIILMQQLKKDNLID